MLNLGHFHSPITKQKLSLIKPSTPRLPYSTYEEINNKYKELSLANKPKENNFINKDDNNANQIKTKYRRSSVSPSFQRKATKRFSIKLDLDALKNPKFENEMSSLVLQQYEKNKETVIQGHINPIVRFFGNNLIASVFQALLIKSIEEVSTNTISEDSNAMSSKILSQFGISSIYLKFLKNSEDKKKYILKCMNGIIENLLKEWKDQIEIQEKHYLAQNKDYEALRQRNKEEIRDRFPWLHLKTKYEGLHKKLKALIIQKLNDYENQISILETLHKRENLTKSLIKINHDELKVTLQDISPPQTSEILKSIKRKDLEVQKSPFQSYHKRINKTYSIDTRISTVSSVKDFSKERSAHTKNLSINTFLENEKGKITPSLLIEKKSFLSKEKEIEWDEEFEEKFKKYMAKGRNLFFNEIRNSKFYEVGVMNMIQELFKEERNNLERTEYSQKYAEGGFLSAAELKFMADTSDLLNSCVDKNYIKKVFNLIDPNILHYMELQLAESIIGKYKEMRGVIVKARNDYIQKNNENLKIKLNRFEYQKNKESEQKILSKSRMRLEKSIKSVVRKIKTKQENFEKTFDKNLQEQITQNHSSPKKIEIDLKKAYEEYSQAKPYGKPEHLEQKNYSQLKEIDLYSSSSHPKIIRHKYHPSSKIFSYIEPDENSQKKQFMMNKDIAKYKLQINSPQALKPKDNFIKFYSGGPKTFEEEPIYKYPQVLRAPTKIEIEAAKRLQRWLKGFIARKKFKELSSSIHMKNFSNFQEKIKKITVKTRKSPEKTRTILNKSLSNTFSSSPPKLQHAFSKYDKSDISNELREMKIINKPPPKNLLLKHRKLLEAAKKNNIYMARNSGFVYYQNDMNIKDKKGNTALYYVTKHCNFEFCSYLIEQGAKVNEPCEEGNTPFHIAFSTNSIELVMLMLDNYGDLNSTNDKGQTPIAFASHSTLKRLDLEKAIATTMTTTSSPSLLKNFDNNQFLTKKKPNEKFQTNEFCNFTLEKMKEPVESVRITNENHFTHLVSFSRK